MPATYLQMFIEISRYAPVAQMDRASVSGTEGQQFEPAQAYHFNLVPSLASNNVNFGCGVFFTVAFNREKASSFAATFVRFMTVVL